MEKCDRCDHYLKYYENLMDDGAVQEVESEPQLFEIIRRLDAVKRIYERTHSPINVAQIQYHKRCLKFFIAECFDTLGLYWYKHVEFEDAIKYFTEAISWDAKYPNPYYNRGVVHYRYGDYQLAVEDMEKAVELDTENDNFCISLEEVKKVVNDIHSETCKQIDHDLKNFVPNQFRRT